MLSRTERHNVTTTQLEYRNSVLIKARVPAVLQQTIKFAAKRELMTPSEWMRRAIVEKLRSDGVEMACASKNWHRVQSSMD